MLTANVNIYNIQFFMPNESNSLEIAESDLKHRYNMSVVNKRHDNVIIVVCSMNDEICKFISMWHERQDNWYVA
jgi:RNA processing factor Prp31